MWFVACLPYRSALVCRVACASRKGIISRNLTPDETGIPVGGFAEFFNSMRIGIDPDHLHPNCNGTTITTNCFNPPFNGDLLQVMVWPELQDLTDRDLLAIYEYLKAVPCIASAGHVCS